MALKEFWLLPHRARTSVGQPYAPSLALRFGAAWNLHIEHGRHQPPVNLGGQVLGHDICQLTRRVNVLDVEVPELGHVFAQSLQWHVYVLYFGVGARVEHPLDSAAIVLPGLRGRLRRALPASGSVSVVTEPLSGVRESCFQFSSAATRGVWC